MRVILIVSLFFAFLRVSADPILVGLNYGKEYLRATIFVESGTYSVTANQEEMFVIKAGQTLDLTASSGKINVFFDGKNLEGNTRIDLVPVSGSTFRIQPAGYKKSGRLYSAGLRAIAYQGRLQLINNIELEDYVSGVIEAESGKGHEIEYYKVQAVISRTYALNNLQRHAAEGYQLCDATHCQVYHGRPYAEPMAFSAARATRDIIIVDAEINLITAAFHSNCGGKTVNAEEVWSKPLSYCVSRVDSFCLEMPHSRWEKSITQERWNSYLSSKRSEYSIAQSDSQSYLSLSGRQYFLADSSLRIPSRVMREDLQLKSTLFRTENTGEHIRFMGRGFGHGVGLCQEGAMRMAQLGYCYEDIIHFYYADVHLIPRYMLWFFRD
ncbi:MAG: SpoIID/LytB domain-containing protein [Flavobacteriales bacterium]|nr:SpoIID/LytB domain-containing protein [Flavobacteriales bacterium]